jgi:hypothetical protein
LLIGCQPSENPTQKVYESAIEIPTFQNSTDTVQFALGVMNFVAKHADVGNLKNFDCMNFSDEQFESINVQHFLQIFEENTGVASFGLAA